ncbi:DUF2237 domain-containing protein [Natronomonas sp. F2-12]|jgi:uncharacterized protein (DUF2237 family)|uniref:DUF2237 domain-containing protein n=1 Tax=Natronomonas aquatica TaxID=2841590 RepID=A0A9R1D4H7_9EURY|nr:DUF2237 domain-containing protein [Natronomonas aquatica]MCQ4331961.1 DUF2237 domain-containing protein [Natronomonas aquatica]
MTERNVLGEELQPCSTDPVTGFERDGCCGTNPGDRGRHELCAVMTAEFLEFSRERGNDLVTPQPAFQFPGLSPGDQWCLCLGRWVEALEATRCRRLPETTVPPVVLEATNEAVLDTVEIETLRAHAYDPD